MNMLVSENAIFTHRMRLRGDLVSVWLRFAHEAASEAGAVSDKGRFAHGHDGYGEKRAKLGREINCFYGNR